MLNFLSKLVAAVVVTLLIGGSAAGAAPLLPAGAMPAKPAGIIPAGLPDAGDPDLETRTGSFHADYAPLPVAESSALVDALYKRVPFPKLAANTREALWDWTLKEDVKIAAQSKQQRPANAPPANAPPASKPATLPPGEGRGGPPDADRPPRNSQPGYAVYVPPTYKPGLLYGVVVFQSPGGSGAIDHFRGYADLCDRHRLIWIAPLDVGNDRPTPWRHYRGTEALAQARRRFTIDPQRTYISGMSGGGRVSSQSTLIYADLFSGGIYCCGSDYPANVPAAEANHFYQGFWPRPDRALLASAKRAGRYVLLTGTHDGNRDGTERVAAAYKKDGFAHSTLLIVPDMGHTMPPADWFDKALAALDEPIPGLAELTKQAAEAARQNRQGDAYLADARAATLAAEGDAAATEAAARAAKRYADYSTQAAAVRAKTAAKDPAGAAADAKAMRQTFGVMADRGEW